MAELPKNNAVDPDPWFVWCKRQCDKWLDDQTGAETDDNKVLLIQLCDVAYGSDLSHYLTDKELDYYVERAGLESPLEFYVIGSDDALTKSAEYVYNTYTDYFKKVAVTQTFYWVEGVDECNDKYTVNVLTGCSLEEFCEKVRTLYNE